MKKCYLSIIILLSLNAQAEHVFKSNPKNYQGSLVVDPYFSESDFIFKQDNPLPWIELERSLSNLIPAILDQKNNFNQTGIANILQERTIQHIYTNTKINQDVVKSTSTEQQTIIEHTSVQVVVSKINTVETENKSNCTEWNPETNTKFTDEMVEQTQECDVHTIDTYTYSINGDVVDQKELNGIIKKNFEQEVEGTKPLVFSSCKEILDGGRSIGNGDYLLNINGSNKNVYCDMNDGGWTLYDEFDSNYFVKNPYGSLINVYTQLTGAGYSHSVTSFRNTYDTLNVNLTNGYKLFFYSGNGVGFIEKNIPFKASIKIIYGNPYSSGSCDIFVNNELKQSTFSNSTNIFIDNLNINDSFKIQETHSICSLDSIWFK